MNIVFPELNHPIIQAAIAAYNADHEPITPIAALDLDTACDLVTSGKADCLIAGIDYSSRDVILACREHFGMGTYQNLASDTTPGAHQNPAPNATLTTYTTFSGLAVMERGDERYLLADMAACKHPTVSQLIEIVHQTYASAQKILADTPRIALLSFSTNGSGGHDDTITLMQSVRDAFLGSDLSQSHLSQSQTGPASTPTSTPTILIDGEMQLDTAVNPAIGQKKFPNSPVAGQANVLIAPDLNTGNILYKAFEQIGGFHVAGPILQGFDRPASDLSRGSSVEDIILTIESMTKLA